MTALVFMLVIGVGLGWFGHREWEHNAKTHRHNESDAGWPWGDQ